MKSSPDFILLISVFALYVCSHGALGAPVGSSWRIEHLFVDDLLLDREDGVIEDPTPMLFKCVGSCDRQGVSTGTRIMVEGCKWASINNRPLILEATSGWFFVMEEGPDGQRKENVEGRANAICGMPSFMPLQAVRPTEEEFASVFDTNEKGYLAKQSAGTFRIIG